jgi:tetratricopeptide (TPR) repeat protein
MPRCLRASHSPTRIAALAVTLLLTAPAQGSEPDSALPPEEVVLQLRAARIAGERGLVEEQRRLLDEIARAHPREPAALLALMEFYSSLPDGSAEAAKARSALRDLLLTPRRDAPLALLQRFALDHRTTKEDLELLAELLAVRTERREDEPGAFLLLSGIQESLDRREEARSTLGALLRQRGDPEVRQRCIHLDILLERWDEALRLVRIQRGVLGEKVLRLAAVQIYAALGMVKELRTEVTAFMSERVLLTHHHLPRMISAGFALYDDGHTKEAAEWFGFLSSRFADDPDLASIQAGLFHRPGQPGARAAGADPANDQRLPVDLMNEGTALLAAGDPHGAYPILKRAASILGENDLAWFNLGLAASELQRWREAEAAFHRAVTLSPRFVKGLVQRAQARLRLQRIDEAVADAEAALRLEPDTKAAYLVLYHCEMARGNEKRAREILTRYHGM